MSSLHRALDGTVLIHHVTGDAAVEHSAGSDTGATLLLTVVHADATPVQ